MHKCSRIALKLWWICMHASRKSAGKAVLPVSRHVQHIPRLQNAAQPLDMFISWPLGEVWMLQVYHGVAVIGVMHWIGVHALERMLW